MPLPSDLLVPSGLPGSLALSSEGAGARSATSVTLSGLGSETAPVLSGPRGRRRALLRGEAGGAERPVLLEWFSAAEEELPRRLAEAQRRAGLCHIHLLRVLQAGALGPRSGFVLSEAPAGVDLLSVLRAARPRGVPAWWLVAVASAVGRGLLALHEQVGEPHGALSPAAIFVGWQGEVQLLAFSALLEEGSGLRREAPETSLRLRVAPGGAGLGLFGAAADVYALALLLQDLLPPRGDEADRERATEGEDAEAALQGLLAQALRVHPSERIGLRDLCAGLGAYLQEVAPPALGQAVGAVLQEIYPRETASDQPSSGELDLTPLPQARSALAESAAVPAIAAPPAALVVRGEAAPRVSRAPGEGRAPPLGIPWLAWALAGLLVAAALALLLQVAISP